MDTGKGNMDELADHGVFGEGDVGNGDYNETEEGGDGNGEGNGGSGRWPWIHKVFDKPSRRPAPIIRCPLDRHMYYGIGGRGKGPEDEVEKVEAARDFQHIPVKEGIQRRLPPTSGAR